MPLTPPDKKGAQELALQGIGFALTRRFQLDPSKKEYFSSVNAVLKIDTYLNHMSVVEHPNRPNEPVIRFHFDNQQNDAAQKMSGIIKYTDGQPSNVRPDKEGGFNVFVGISTNQDTNNLMPFLKDFLKYPDDSATEFLKTIGFNDAHIKKMENQYEASKPSPLPSNPAVLAAFKKHEEEALKTFDINYMNEKVEKSGLFKKTPK